MEIGHLFTFLWAIINNWAGYATGGLIMALIFFGQTWSKKWEPSKKILKVCCIVFLALAIFKSWDEQYTSATTRQKLLEDKSPKLDGFVHRTVIADEPGTTNSLILVELGVGNSGGVPSIAGEFRLMVLLSKGKSTNAEAISFPDEYKCNFLHKGKPWLLDLKRPQLISEKTIKAIPIGESPRGWVAFRLNGIPMSHFQPTNVVLSFVDVGGTRVYVTNGVWKGKPSSSQPQDDLTDVIPGAENIFYPVEPPARTDWLPPDLPQGCSNVVVFFGTEGIILHRDLAEISTVGKRFSISQLPDSLLKDLDKTPNYSPRQRDIWFRALPPKLNIGGKTVDYPIQPIVISNRLYIEVEIPFSNERRKLVMSDAFSSELPIPPAWDINFSTNYDAYGNGIYAYEVVNEMTNPVLQVAYSAPNEVRVNGIFQVDSNSILAAFGDRPMLGTFILRDLDTNKGLMTASLEMENFHETLIIHSNETLASFGQRFTNEFFRPIFKYQKPLFKYPSNRNLGVFADTSVGNLK
jgi:hypothetical protein